MATQYPTFDGHFWVMRDGKIIDFDFPFYNFVKKVQNCGGETIYLPAPPLVQKKFIKMFKKITTKAGIDDKFFKKYWEITQGCCYDNARMEIAQRGGELVFGSMGWKKQQGIHYEYGGENWTVSQHLKK